jgi:superfamily I DNA/RNA helicase
MSFQLNTHQQQVVEFGTGPLAVIAGPGTGKTRTLVSRIIRLINAQRVSPQTITALTFTNKAADEMSTRLKSALPAGSLPYVGTFHSLCLRLLSQIGFSPKIIDSQTRLAIISRLSANSQSSLQISLAKNTAQFDPILKPLIDSYQQELQKLDLIDYDDILIEALKLLKTDSQFLLNAQSLCRYLLVDEFQDTSPIQYQIIRLLAGPSPNLCVIGDPLQSVYSFRGADSRVFEVFFTDFPSAAKIHLLQNYRSGPSIISTSHRLFPDSPCPQPALNNSSRVALVKTSSVRSASRFIADFINLQMAGLDLNSSRNYSQSDSDASTSFSDIAILYRINDTGRQLASAFINSNIPFQLSGESSIFCQKGIVRLVAILRHLYSPQLPTFLNPSDLTLAQSVAVDFGQLSLSQLVSSLAPSLKISPLDLQYFLSTIYEFDRHPICLDRFFEYLDLISANNYLDPRADRVVFSTIHSAKGLEFKFVFLLGFEQGLVPFAVDNDEEKRLLYVALTRAKQELFLLYQKEISPYYSIIRNPTIETINPFPKSRRPQLKLF